MVPVKVNLAPEYTPTLTDELDLQCNGQLVCPPSQQVVYSLQVSTDERRKIKSYVRGLLLPVEVFATTICT